MKALGEENQGEKMQNETPHLCKKTNNKELKE